MSALLPNEVNHQRHKDGVEVELIIRTAKPLPPAEFSDLAEVITAIHVLFSAIPDQSAGGAE